MKALAFVALLALDSTAAGQDIIGQATVIDGDTIEIHLQRIRLWGIDAPESDQLGGADSELFRCGSAAASGLADHIAGHVVGCSPRATDRYQRVAAFAWPMWRRSGAVACARLGSRLTGRSTRAGLIPRIRRRRQGRARACLPETFSSLGNIALAFERPTAGGPSPGAPKGNRNAFKHGRCGGDARAAIVRGFDKRNEENCRGRRMIVNYDCMRALRFVGTIELQIRKRKVAIGSQKLRPFFPNPSARRIGHQQILDLCRTGRPHRASRRARS